MGTYHKYADLAYLAWETIFIPVLPLPNGDHQFFTDENGVAQFSTEEECRAFLATKQAQPAQNNDEDEDDEVTGGAYYSDQDDYASAVSELD